MRIRIAPSARQFKPVTMQRTDDATILDRSFFERCSDGVRPAAAPYIERHGVDLLSSNVGAHAAQTDVRCLVVPAARRASGPVNGQRLAVAHVKFLEGFR